MARSIVFLLLKGNISLTYCFPLGVYDSLVYGHTIECQSQDELYEAQVIFIHLTQRAAHQ